MQPILVITGQHLDVQMSQVFFVDLTVPEPDHLLGVSDGTHATQLSGSMGRNMISCQWSLPRFDGQDMVRELCARESFLRGGQ